MSDRHEFLEKYSEVIVTFSNYYKYRFTFRGVMPDGSELICQKGGDIDSIYRLDVNNKPISLSELWPDTVEVRNSDGLLITWF
jgi:hypothetical protein